MGTLCHPPQGLLLTPSPGAVGGTRGGRRSHAKQERPQACPVLRLSMAPLGALWAPLRLDAS